MKALLISSSPHKEKSNTFSLAKEVLKGFSQEGGSIETIHLDDFSIFFCKHCEQCHKTILHCSLKDEVGIIIKKMLETDAIILASPNYINQVTGSMKTFFDRSAHFIHCKRLLGKYIAGVVTSGSGQDKAVLDYIKYFGHTCGAQFSGGISSRNLLIKEKTQEAIALGKKIASDIKNKQIYPDQMEVIEKGRKYFCEVIKARKDDWREEYKYWLDKDWL